MQKTTSNIAVLLVVLCFFSLGVKTSSLKLQGMYMSNSPFDGIMRGLGIKKAQEPNSISVDETVVPDVESLRARLASQQTPAERNYYTELAAGRGPADSRAALRLFDAPEGTKPRVTLYRDHAAWCPYCEKVWLQLEEKRIPYEVKKVPLRCYGDKPQWFRAVSPGGMLPVAEIDGQIISESNDIMQALEDVFPENSPLIPEADAEGRHKFNSLLRLERELFSVWFRWLTSPGRDAPQRAQFKEVMGRVNGALAASGGAYFLGGELTLVDVMFTPFLERMAASLLYFKALDLRNNPDWPALEAWYQAMDQRPAYQGIKSDYYTHCHDLPPQIGGSFAVDEAKPYADAIDGLDGESWALPLPGAPAEPAGPLAPDAARREAAARLLHNFDAVASFAARGVGKPGFPPAMAPLADPNAEADSRYEEQVKIALRCIVSGLLMEESAAPSFYSEASNQLSGLNRAEVGACLAYLRDRVGVPRDMSLDAARRLRAHLNCLLDAAALR